MAWRFPFAKRNTSVPAQTGHVVLFVNDAGVLCIIDDEGTVQAVGDGSGIPQGGPLTAELDANGNSIINVGDFSASGIIGISGTDVTLSSDTDIGFNSPIQVGELLYGNHINVAIVIGGNTVELVNRATQNSVVTVDNGSLTLRSPDGNDMLIIENTSMGFFGNGAVAQPTLPASPDSQDIADALVALGVVLQET